MRNAITLIAATAALVVAVLGMSLARAITGPLRQLVEGAAEIGGGNLGHRIAVGTSDELGQLADAFNEMAANRQQAEAALLASEEQLRRQQRLAAIGQLAGGISHELRNPLGAIKNATFFLNMVLESPEPEVKETLAILDREVARSDQIITSLLDFARPTPPSRQQVDLNRVVRDALSHIAVPDGVAVVTQLDTSLPTVLANPVGLAQAFGNLILNGIQTMPGGGRLVIKATVNEPEWVIVSVADTGEGIPEENLARLFEPLFTTKAVGIGLGLALVKTIVEGHGGMVEVHSELGQGSIFTVKLPIGDRE